MNPIARVIDGRRSMRTLADGLAKLAEAGWLKEGDHATVRAIRMQLPDGAVVATVAIIPPGGPSESVMLPAAARFRANNTVGERRERDLDELDGAITDPAGNVQLRDDSYVHAVEIIPVRLHEELTKAEEKVLLCVLDILGVKKESYRPVHAELLPGVLVLDYALVAQVGAERERELRNLKAIEWAIEREVLRRMPHIKRQTLVKRQTLATVLARAGLRRPRSGTRARPRSSTATILPPSV